MRIQEQSRKTFILFRKGTPKTSNWATGYLLEKIQGRQNRLIAWNYAELIGDIYNIQGYDSYDSRFLEEEPTIHTHTPKQIDSHLFDLMFSRVAEECDKYDNLWVVVMGSLIKREYIDKQSMLADLIKGGYFSRKKKK